MSNILDNFRKLNSLLQIEKPRPLFAADVCELLRDVMDANLYALDVEGKVLGHAFKIEKDSVLIKDEETGVDKVPEKYNDAMIQMDQTRPNISADQARVEFKDIYETSTKLLTIIPIIGGGIRLGTLVMTRYDNEFTDDDLLLGEFCATIIGALIRRQKRMQEQEEAREESVVRMAIGTLSYSETEAVQHIFEELDGDEGILVASKIADRSGITRSVIVNALRKLESASVIETRSLGMKGTRIKILNPKLKSELDKIKEF